MKHLIKFLIIVGLIVASYFVGKYNKLDSTIEWVKEKIEEHKNDKDETNNNSNEDTNLIITKENEIFQIGINF